MKLMVLAIALLVSSMTLGPGASPSHAAPPPNGDGPMIDVQPNTTISIRGRRYNVYVWLNRNVPGIIPDDGVWQGPFVTLRATVVLEAQDGQAAGSFPDDLRLTIFGSNRRQRLTLRPSQTPVNTYGIPNTVTFVATTADPGWNQDAGLSALVEVRMWRRWFAAFANRNVSVTTTFYP